MVILMIVVVIPDADMKVHLAMDFGVVIMAAAMMFLRYHNDPDPIPVVPMVLIGHRDPRTS
jgi:hypothetical protein